MEVTDRLGAASREDLWALCVRQRRELRRLERAARDYLTWCERSINAGPVGNPRTHAWHNQQIREALAALSDGTGGDPSPTGQLRDEPIPNPPPPKGEG